MQNLTMTLNDKGLYNYSNQYFFIADGLGFGNDPTDPPHNFGYCMAIHTSFTYMGGEVFSFTGDDDVWVFVNGTRMIDLGGIHSAQSANFSADDMNLVPGHSYNFDFFYCERHSVQSTFAAETSLSLFQCEGDKCGYCRRRCNLAGPDSDGDGTRDCQDLCPHDPRKTVPGRCGCGNTEDSCPEEPEWSEAHSSSAEPEPDPVESSGGETPIPQPLPSSSSSSSSSAHTASEHSSPSSGSRGESSGAQRRSSESGELPARHSSEGDSGHNKHASGALSAVPALVAAAVVAAAAAL
eukprot:m51a1_g1031 hypothetical protein (295) ;mRNA; f:670319-671203